RDAALQDRSAGAEGNRARAALRLSFERSIRMKTVPPFVLHPASAPGVPLVLDSPHSGEHYPDDFDHAPPRSVVRLAEDTHVGRLYRPAAALGATLVEANFP